MNNYNNITVVRYRIW